MSVKKILVVEDVAVERKRITDILAASGYTVTQAVNGREAIEKAGVERPDLIFMDIIMPEIDGFAACRQITSATETKNIPVVIVSSKSQQADKVWAQLQGAAALIGKPYEDEAILEQARAFA